MEFNYCDYKPLRAWQALPDGHPLTGDEEAAWIATLMCNLPEDAELRVLPRIHDSWNFHIRCGYSAYSEKFEAHMLGTVNCTENTMRFDDIKVEPSLQNSGTGTGLMIAALYAGQTLGLIHATLTAKWDGTRAWAKKGIPLDPNGQTTRGIYQHIIARIKNASSLDEVLRQQWVERAESQDPRILTQLIEDPTLNAIARYDNKGLGTDIAYTAAGKIWDGLIPLTDDAIAFIAARAKKPALSANPPTLRACQHGWGGLPRLPLPSGP